MLLPESLLAMNFILCLTLDGFVSAVPLLVLENAAFAQISLPCHVLSLSSTWRRYYGWLVGGWGVVCSDVCSVASVFSILLFSLDLTEAATI